uniref:Uncharacterized protein n=1 Tax=Arundo donax TaxID=35708 RepID=A0A0A9EBH8_ARUDO
MDYRCYAAKSAPSCISKFSGRSTTAADKQSRTSDQMNDAHNFYTALFML